MKPIKINVDSVPEDKRTHPDYLGLLNSMTLGMADPDTVLSVCIHEAGHVFFGLEMKMKVLGMEGPRILYVEPDQFQGHALKAIVKIMENTVEQIAVMLSAGGIFSRELDNSLGPGDSEDREIFNATCHDAGLTDSDLIKSLWNAGQRVVEDRLKNDDFREIARNLARRIMSDIEKQGAFE